MKVNATNVSYDPPSYSLLTPHDPISITSDSNFTDYGFPGSGTAENPYLIEGYDIATTDNDGIYISGTTKHFIVGNCYIEAKDYGIYIGNVAAGTASIVNNTCNNNIGYYSWGIYIDSSSGSTVSNNTCNNNNSKGIYIDSSSGSTVSNNTCNNNSGGIQLHSSSSSTVSNNTCINNNLWGILLYNSVNSDVVNNTCNDNNLYGILIESTDSLTVANNTCSNSDYGIYLNFPDFCVIADNILRENEYYGVVLATDSDNNLIHHNTFVDNNLGGTSQAKDDGANNYWYDTLTLEGNYYNDWSGTGSYAIDGTTGSYDLYPLDYPPSEPSLTPHDSISITSDSGFLVFPGSGTVVDPYLIEGYNITTTDNIGINIEGTTKHFIVRNCYVDANDYGVRLSVLAEGTATVTNNTCNNNDYGIFVNFADSSTISNNMCSNNSYSGIYFDNSGSSTVINNTCNNNEKGIHIHSSSDSFTVANNTCNNNTYYGILFYWSVNTDVVNNTCNNNNLYGIDLYNSSSFTVVNNTVSNNNDDGILLSSCYYCNVTYNLLQDNVGYGIVLNSLSENNLIHHNTFVDNKLSGTSQARDDGTNNYWYDTVALEGNYYNDWSGTGSYAIDGTAGSYDLYPLDNPPYYSLTPHDSISITSDIGFVAFPGSGTAEDPYLIEGYDITTTDNIGIHIADTTKYFVVRNCYVDANDYGIYIDNVAAGTAIVIYNTCNNNNLRGIYIWESSGSTVANNTCSNNGEYGIYLGDSVSSTVANNTCINNNLYGIYIDSSGSSTIANNLCSYNNHGILFYWSINSDVTNNICSNNDINGIYLYASDHSTVANNTCNNNSGDGILLEYSGVSIVEDNTCKNNNLRGIYIYESDSCEVTNNILQDNVGYGVSLSTISNNNLIHHNNFVDNNLGGTSQAYDDGTNNYWYDTVALEGNYYNDWSGTGSYAIDGSAGAIDLYPLDEPTVYLGPPVITNIIHSPSFPTELDTISINATVTSPYGVYSVTLHYRINGGSWQTISMTLVSGDLYSVTIGSFAPSDTIEYYVSAEDNSVSHNEAINDNAGLYYSFTISLVIPEFQIFSLLLPTITFLFLVFGLAVLQRRKK